ncbi:helix-turn-helix domain-containing protein [Streptomyces rishiriensis]|uniref:helix-turn-helix domain-containing protein n=1 Tax=Streptomyces rishiriensis TaxID=68264 RepID=UPI0037D37702
MRTLVCPPCSSPESSRSSCWTSTTGLTQARLAGQAGMSQGALSRLEHGRGVPTLPLLERLAAALSSNLLISLSPHGAIHVVFKAPPR